MSLTHRPIPRATRKAPCHAFPPGQAYEPLPEPIDIPLSHRERVPEVRVTGECPCSVATSYRASFIRGLRTGLKVFFRYSPKGS
jgi:hypothetical protein